MQSNCSMDNNPVTGSKTSETLDIEICRTLVEHMVNGVAYCRMLYCEGQPSDFVYLYTNPAFEKLTGLKQVIGKPVSEVIPGIRETDPQLFDIYSRVAIGGEPVTFETFVEPLAMWFSISVYSPQSEHFIAIFDVITERKLNELALSIANKRWSLAQRAAVAGAWYWEIATSAIYWSDELYELFGLEPQQKAAGFETWQELLHSEDRQQAEQRISQAISDHLPLNSEYRIITPAGEIRWIRALGDTDYDEQGLARCMTGICIDITKTKVAEEALRESQRDLSHAQAVAHIGSWRMDARNNRLEWSDEAFRIFGVTNGTPLTYHSFLDSVHPADRHFVDAAWQDALTGKPYDIEHRIIVNQKVKWVRELAELEFDEHGALIGALGTTEDITDIKMSQEALQHERAFLRQVIDTTPSMIFVKDREGRFLLGNEALLRCYGTNSESLIGLTDENFNPNAEEVSRFNQDDRDVISSCLPKLIPEEKVTHADGSEHWYSTIKTPLIDNDNRCNKLLGVATDITERMRVEEALRMADRRKDQFLAMLAHELRNPLAPIRNTVQLLKMQEAIDPTLASSLDVIDRQVSHMARLLDDLLDVARIMQGKIALKVERFELTAIVNDAIETTRALIESRGQELIILKTATPLWVEGDRVRLAQVLYNLLNNAAKYTGEGGKITLSIMREGADAVIEVRDAGIGIAPDILPQIFELFIQADQSLAHSQGGLGIGLTLVRQLVEIHGGTITAASAGIGQGSVFTVRLPVVSMESSTIESEQTQSTLPVSKFRILIVDDYADAAESMAMLLQMEGHEVEIADCGMKAIERAQVFHPQIVLLDIGLPDIDGYEVAKRLRLLPETQDAILIALTGYGRAEDLERSQLAGFNHHLLKPVSLGTLSALLASSNCSGTFKNDGMMSK